MTTTSSTTTNPASALYAAINSANASSSSSSTSSSTSDTLQSSFLTMLTTQLQNQDPLNPMDNAQLTSQLAQINMVSGISQLNTTLNSLISDSTTSQALQAAALTGHSVLVAGSSLTLGSSGALGGYELASAADTVTIQVKNSSGSVVRTITETGQTAGVHDFVWDGNNDSGTAQSTGSYTFSVSASNSGSSVTSTALTLGTVDGVLQSTSGITLDLGSLGQYTMSNIKQFF